MNIPEQDWKYLNSIKKDLLELLSKRINDEATSIICVAYQPSFKKKQCFSSSLLNFMAHKIRVKIS
jgi:hypothetical protein